MMLNLVYDIVDYLLSVGVCQTVVNSQFRLEPEMFGDGQCFDEDVVLLHVAWQFVYHAEVCHHRTVDTQLTVHQQTARVTLIKHV